MKYLKTNESLFTRKAQKVFSKLIEDLEKRLTQGKYKFKNEPNKVSLGRSDKDIIEMSQYTIIKDDIEYLLKVALIKEGNFGNPFVHARVYGHPAHEVRFNDDYSIPELRHMQLSEDSLSIYELLEEVRDEILDRNKMKNAEKSFYEEFPIDDIKDRLLDLSDEFGMPCEVSKMEGGDIGYDVDMDLNIKFKKIERHGGHYIKVDSKMDIYSKVIIEINNLSKVFNSMGLTMLLDPYYLINSGSISFKLFKTIK
jgi:hypothetical protein